MNYNIINGNSAEVLKQYPDNYFDAVVTDPPYGINFLGKDWDSNTGEEAVYRECFRVLKPGGHLLAFSAARTYHHLAMSVERSGFEIRDQIMWIYGSGFPKSQNVGKMIDSQLETGSSHTSAQRKMAMGENYNPAGHYTVFPSDQESELAAASKETKKPAQWTPKTDLAKQYQGWGTALKPAHEPIVVARKPLISTVAKNVQEWGVGALNIDASRVGDLAERTYPANGMNRLAYGEEANKWEKTLITTNQGRFPANIIHDGSQEVVELFPDSNGAGGSIPDTKVSGYGEFSGRGKSTYTPNNRTPVDSGSGSAARFFYCAKVSRSERNIGCDDLEPKNMSHDGREKHIENPYQRHNSIVANNHPTVKPVDLMRYLIRLVTPANSRVLDPFCGSGSTGMAAVELGHEFVGIELDPRYCEIASRRIEGWIDQLDPITRSPLFGDGNV